MRKPLTEFPHITATKKRAAAKPERGECQNFLNCTNPATTTIPNPILGPVPCCAKCAAWYERMSK